MERENTGNPDNGLKYVNPFMHNDEKRTNIL